MAARWISISNLAWESYTARASMPWTAPAGAVHAGVRLPAKDQATSYFRAIDFRGTAYVASTPPPGQMLTVRFGNKVASVPLVQGETVLTAVFEDLAAPLSGDVVFQLEGPGIGGVWFAVTKLQMTDFLEGNVSNRAGGNWYEMNSGRNIGLLPYSYGPSAPYARPGIVLRGGVIAAAVPEGERLLGFRASGKVETRGNMSSTDDFVTVASGESQALAPFVSRSGSPPYTAEYALPAVAIGDNTAHDFVVTLESVLHPVAHARFFEPKIEIQVEPVVGPTPRLRYEDQTPTTPAGSFVLQFVDESVAGDSAIVSWSWNFGNGNVSSSKIPPPQEYPIPASESSASITLRVVDAEGNSATGMWTIDFRASGPGGLPVGTIPPTAAFDVSGPFTVPAGQNHVITYTDLSVAGSVPISTWTWELGEGRTHVGRTPPPQTYYALGSTAMQIKLTVTDANGLSDSHSGTLNLVKADPPPPQPAPPIRHADPAPETMGVAPPLPPMPDGYPTTDREYGPLIGSEVVFGQPVSGLSKLGAVVVTKRGVADSPRISPVRMDLFGVPLPYGMAYRWYTADEVVRVIFPSTGSYEVPPGATLIYQQVGTGTPNDPYRQVPYGYTYTKAGKPLITKPADFATWSQLNDAAGPGWFGMPGNMRRIEFPGQSVAPNGYPKPGHNGPIWGYFDVPTISGMHREWRTYYRAKQGAPWYPAAFVNPAYCKTGGAAYVTMLADFPGAPAVRGTPTERKNDLKVGWNAGANSIIELGNNLATTYTIDIGQAGAVGFVAGRNDVGDHTTLSHAFYYDLGKDGKPRASVTEKGIRVSGYRERAATDTYKITRIDGIVTYLVNGQTFYTSTKMSFGALRVGTSLYAAMDVVGQESP